MESNAVLEEKARERKPRSDGTVYVCRCECGDQVRGQWSFGRLFTFCEKCTPVVTVNATDRNIHHKGD